MTPDTHNPDDTVRAVVADLRRTVTDLLDLSSHCAEDRTVAFTGPTALPTVASTAAAAQAVDAVRGRLEELAATSASLADGVTRSAERYDAADRRAEARLSTRDRRGPPEDPDARTTDAVRSWAQRPAAPRTDGRRG